MKIYLCSRYGRRQELERYAALLKAEGHEITSSWLKGEHEAKELLPVGSLEGIHERGLWAMLDLADLEQCDMLIAFTEPPDSVHGRGGRHVELGVALATNKTVIVCGPRENIFCNLPRVTVFPTWGETLSAIKRNPTK